MLDKFIKVFTFKTGVYKEVEDNAAFTPTAWMIVAVVALLSSLGGNAASAHALGGRWIFGALGSAVFAILGFALGSFVISWAGKTFFNAEVTFEEMVRTLGLAYIWKVVGFLGIIALAAPGLACVSGPITFFAGLAGLVAWFFAAKEALDLEWPQTIGSVIIGWVVTLAVTVMASTILGILGLVGAGVGTLFGAL